MANRLDPEELWEQAGGGTPGLDLERYRDLFRQHWLPAESGFPGPADMNWELINELAARPHPLVNNEWQPPEAEDPGWLIEMFHEMRAVHHLLDLIGVPPGYSDDTRDIDSRVLVAVRGYLALSERLARISGWHERETGPAGTVGDFCTDCGHRWPCDSRRMADGVYVDEDDDG